MGIQDVQRRLRQLASDLWVEGPDQAVKAADPDVLRLAADMLGDWTKTQWSLDEECNRRRRVEAELVDMAHERDEILSNLRKIGRLVGCGHVDDPDARAKLVRCVRESLIDD